MPGQQDTVHSYKPSIPTTYQYHLKPGESFYKDRNGKITIIRSKNEQVNKDTRNDWQKQQDSKNASNVRKQKQIKYLKEGQETRGLATQEWIIIAQKFHRLQIMVLIFSQINL